jgi:aryl-alcohol dehydrogenase-like predicted oxidoreductase
MAAVLAQRIAGLDKPVSRLVMGAQPSDRAFEMFDDYFARGGNTFDTAYIYGELETVLGEWIRSRGVRDQVVILAKGAHSPLCTPQALSVQLIESLSRMGTDYVDMYALHRDNLDVPAGEFVDVLNQHAKAGYLRVFGGSNWTLARMNEGNAYAEAHGLAGFGFVNNNLSLARMVEPLWSGCRSANDPASLAWFARTQTPLFCWSSQARGFFVRGDRAIRDDKELVRCWYARDNFKRFDRARELAAEYRTAPMTVALAWVLRQAFPTFALIGPQSVAETASCFRATELTLTPDEVRWLNLGAWRRPRRPR